MNPKTVRDRTVVERFGRSLSGATLDVVLIVVSILIAFALDAWWDGRQRAEDEREALMTLSEELHASRVELDSVVEYNIRQVGAARYYVSLAGRDPGSVPRDSLFVAFNGISGGMTFDPSTGAVEAILAARLPRDPELRAKIGAWPGMLREIEADQGFILQRYEKLSDALVEAGLATRITDLRVRGAALRRGDEEGRERLDAELRGLMQAMLSEPILVQRVSALGNSIGGLLFELEEVEARLAVLETEVASRLAAGR